MSLTDSKVKQAKPKDKPYLLKDIDGLFLFVASNGRKSWHFRFSWQSKQPRISFGTYPEISLKEARALRDKARSQVTKGINPRQQKPQLIANTHSPTENHGITFAEFAQRWKAFKFKKLGRDKTQRRQSTAIQIERYLHKDKLPILGNLPLKNIVRSDVLKVQRKIENRGALTIAEKCRSWLNELFRHAIVEELIQTNPVVDIDIVAQPQRPTQHNPLSTITEN